MNSKPQVDGKLVHVGYKFTFDVCLINAMFNVSNIRELSFTYTANDKLRISQKRKRKLGHVVKRKLGHVVQIVVCRLK